MGWQSFGFITAVALAAPFAAMLAAPLAPAAADEPLRVSGPAVHENLAVYFLHGRSAAGAVPLTLKEALAAGKVVVHETGDVSMLAIENTSAEEVFVQAGDIVKGGQQDRVLTISMLVPARSGRLDIGAFCVERGRWSARGMEDVKQFNSAQSAMPSRDAKLAILAPPMARAASALSPGPGAGATTGQTVGQEPAGRARAAEPHAQQLAAGYVGEARSRQSEVWSSVARAQQKLTDTLGAPVAAPASASSLQLSLENERLQAARRAYMAALEHAAGADDIVGYVFAVGGKLNAGDVYGSNALFRKMWDKQLEAAVTEAIAEKRGPSAAAPTSDDVRAFLARAESGTLAQTPVSVTALVRETRDSDTSLLAETRRAAGGLIHRAYVAK